MAKISKRVAVVIKDKEQLAEGLRTTAGLLLENHTASMFVLGQVIEITDKYKDDLEFLKEMDGMAYTDMKENAEQMDFDFLRPEELIRKLKENEIIIPF
jgi:hypothetical protein